MDTTAEIFDRRYLVRVPELFMRSRADMALYGTPITGYKAIDNDLPNRTITTYMSIADMVDRFRDGAVISVVNYDDIQPIYESIVRHLTAWKNTIEIAINMNDPPIDDLLVMDEFAEVLFQHARHHYRTSPLLTGMTAELNKVSRRSAKSFLMMRKELNKPIGNSLPTRPKHTEFLKQKAMEQRKR